MGKELFVWFRSSGGSVIVQRVKDDCLAFQAGQVEEANLGRS